MQNRYIPARGRKKLKIGKDKVIIFTLVVVLSLCSLTVGMLVAKYLNEKSSDGLVRAYNFYFTSNLLDGKEHKLAPGSTEITFTLGNHADDLRYSEVDIEYTVTVDNGATVETGKETGKLEKGDIKDAEVTISNLTPGTYNITAVGKGGYTKTLTATIVVPTAVTSIYYNTEAFDDYTLLTIWNEGDEEGNVTVTYTGIPDNTNPDMQTWTTNSSGTLTIAPHASKVLRFFGETDFTTISGATNKSLN